MKFPRLLVFACSFSGGLAVGRAADATSPVDYARQNGTFAPAATVTAAVTTPQPAAAVQEKRVETTTLDKKAADLGDRRAAVETSQAREKVVREKDSSRPEARERVMSDFNHREATVTTAVEPRHPALVSKYQSSLVAASVSNMARFPAAGTATTAKINRFVFRKNAPDTGAALKGAAVTPVAGDSAGQK